MVETHQCNKFEVPKIPINELITKTQIKQNAPGTL